MKDIITCTPLSPMGKIGVLKKDKSSTKKVKDTKTVTKNSIKGKIPKICMKKAKSKSKDSKSKLSEKKKNLTKKKNENKRELKKKAAKEEKSQKKILKNSLDIGKKRKLSQKNHIIKSNGDHAPPLKVPKITPSNGDTNRVINGNANIQETSQSPWILKLDLPSQRSSAIPNGVAKGGALINPLRDKSILFIPKKNAVSGMILKGNPSITYLKKDESTKTDKSVNISKPLASKSIINSSKETSKKADSNSGLVQCLDKAKKNEVRLPFSKSQKFGSNKDLKLGISSEQKSCSKEQKLISISNEKMPSRDQASSCVKKSLSKEAKQPSLKHQKTMINKSEMGLNSKETKIGSAKSQKTFGKEIKQSNRRSCPREEKALCIREPTKMHPQRMASLDAMAKMHVICSTDRRPSVDVSKIIDSSKEPTESHIQRKSIVESSKKIQIGIKKETKEVNGHIIHSRINCVKVEESSISERRDIRTYSAISQNKEVTLKRPRGRPRLKPASESPEPDSFPMSSLTKRKSSASSLKDIKSKKAVKKDDGKGARVHSESAPEKQSKKSKKREVEVKTGQKQQCKVENTKSKVKVKETIRMRKTCTYQSVTTVSSHEAVNSVVESCSRLGVTTNYETKKTVVTDEACEKKTDLRLEDVHQRPFTPITDDHSSIPPVSNCCGHNNAHIMHPLPQATIPYAHSQSCHGFQGTRNANSSPQHHCDCNYNMHRCGHQQHVMYQRPSHDWSCCCSGSLVQSIHDACLLTKETNSCAHHSHCHINSSPFSLCSHCHISTEGRRHHEPHFNLAPVPGCQNRWCRCYNACHDSRHHQQVSCTQCPMVSAKSMVSSVPCDQSPLDLSLGAGTTQSMGNSYEQSRANCPTHHCCQDLARFQSSPHHNYQHRNPNFSYPTNCSPCQPHSSDFAGIDKSQLTQLSSDKGSCGLVLQSKQTPEPLQFVSTASNRALSIQNEPVLNVIHQEQSTTQNCSYSSTKQERINSIHSRLHISKKKKFAHGWSWEGEPVKRMLALTNDSLPELKRCFPAMRHKEGDIIKERDCVLLKSGPKDTDLPYVAKVAAFWENDDDGEMMMSLLWYYRPEHTEQGRGPGQMEDEVFASKHRDVNSVACIEDKCYVLTFNEYCRYRANLAMVNVSPTSQASHYVPELAGGYPRKNRLPTEYVSPDMVFFCRHVYDYRQKRILKNPASTKNEKKLIFDKCDSG